MLLGAYLVSQAEANTDWQQFLSTSGSEVGLLKLVPRLESPQISFSEEGFWNWFSGEALLKCPFHLKVRELNVSSEKRSGLRRNASFSLKMHTIVTMMVMVDMVMTMALGKRFECEPADWTEKAEAGKKPSRHLKIIFIITIAIIVIIGIISVRDNLPKK